MIDETVVQVIESSTDLKPVLDSMELLLEQLQMIQTGVLVLCGVVLGTMVIVVLAEVFR